jgi:hypothetical protein
MITEAKPFFYIRKKLSVCTTEKVKQNEVNM